MCLFLCYHYLMSEGQTENVFQTEQWVPISPEARGQIDKWLSSSANTKNFKCDNEGMIIRDGSFFGAKERIASVCETIESGIGHALSAELIRSGKMEPLIQYLVVGVQDDRTFLVTFPYRQDKPKGACEQFKEDMLNEADRVLERKGEMRLPVQRK